MVSDHVDRVLGQSGPGTDSIDPPGFSGLKIAKKDIRLEAIAGVEAASKDFQSSKRLALLVPFSVSCLGPVRHSPGEHRARADAGRGRVWIAWIAWRIPCRSFIPSK